jgi:hypothetical protein
VEVDGRGEEATSIPAGDGGASRDQTVSEVDGVADTQAAVPATGARNRTRFQGL